MTIISDAAEFWLTDLEREFGYELSNHAIGSEHVHFPSGTQARLAMLRQAYLKGREDALAIAADFDRDVQALAKSAESSLP